MYLPVNQNSSALLKRFLDECNCLREVLNNILIINIIHVNVEVLVILPSFCLLVVEAQGRDDVRDSGFL